MVGIAIGWWFRHSLSPYWPALLAVTACWLIVLFWKGHKRLSLYDRSFGTLHSFFWALLGCTSLLHAYDSLQKETHSCASVYRGVVVERMRLGPRSATYEMALADAFFSDRWQRCSENISLTLTPIKGTLPREGDVIMFYAPLEKPRNSGNPLEFDYASWLLRKGISGTAFCGNHYRHCSAADSIGIYQAAGIWTRFRILTGHVRHRLTSLYAASGIEGRDWAVLSALTLGDKRGLDKTTRLLFSETGASHVLALSGLHLGILFMMLFVIFSPFRHSRSGRVFFCSISLLVIWSFSFIAGLGVSLQRSALMYSLFLLMYIRNEQGISLDRLSLSAIIILLISPMALMDIGFQLSFVAVLGILLFQPWYSTHQPVSRWARLLMGMVFVAVIAQLATAPLVAYVFHVLPLLFLLSNFIVLSSAYLLLGGALLFFLTLPCDMVHLWIGHLMSAVVSGMCSGLESISRLPWSSLEVYPSLLTMLLAYAAMTVLLLVVTGRRFRYAVMSLLTICAFGLSWLHDRYGRSLPPEIVFYHHPSGPAVHFIHSSSQSVLWSDSTTFSNVENHMDVFWKTYRMSPLSWKEAIQKRWISEHQGIVAFDNTRVVLAQDSMWRHARVKTPLPVDVLYLSKGCYMPLQSWLSLFRPKMIVLDTSLGTKRAEAYKTQAASLHRDCHDIRTDGAYILSLPPR